MKTRFAAVLAAALCAGGAQAQFVINEIDSDTEGIDAEEFVEIQGPASSSLAGYVLVFFGSGTGVNRSYLAIDLTGSTDANGYYLVANAAVPGADQVFPGNTLQNGEDAVGLYQDNSASFPTGTLPTATSLQSYVIYETGADTNRTWTGFGGATTVYDENQYGVSALRSLSRLPDGTGTSFEATNPTPKAPNAVLPDEQIVASRSPLDFGQFNAVTTANPTTLTLTLTNRGKGTATLSTFELGAGSDAVFSIVQGPDPALPATLAGNESTSVVVQFQNSATASNQVFSGVINYATTGTETGSVDLAAAYVNVSEVPAPGAVVINEICYNPAGDWNQNGFRISQDDEFVELYNTTAAPIAIEGWEIRLVQGDGTGVGSYVFPAGATIAGNGYVVLFADGPLSAFASGMAFDYQGGAYIYNGGSRIALNAGATQIDGVAYGAGEDSPDADGFTNMGVLEVGGSIGRRPDGAATFMAFVDNAAELLDRPTPAASNNGPTAAADWSVFE